MASLNKVHIIGNLTRDPELRVTPKGTSICSLSVAINRQYKDESGATRDDTTFVDCEAWGKTGELIAKYLGKGALGYFEGRLKLDQWDDKQSGQKRSKIKVIVESVQFLGSPKDSNNPTRQTTTHKDEADDDVRYEPTPKASGGKTAANEPLPF